MTLGNVMAEVVVAVGDLEIVSAITRASAESLGVKPRDTKKKNLKKTQMQIDKT